MFFHDLQILCVLPRQSGTECIFGLADQGYFGIHIVLNKPTRSYKLNSRIQPHHLVRVTPLHGSHAPSNLIGSDKVTRLLWSFYIIYLVHGGVGENFDFLLENRGKNYKTKNVTVVKSQKEIEVEAGINEKKTFLQTQPSHPN